MNTTERNWDNFGISAVRANWKRRQAEAHAAELRAFDEAIALWTSRLTEKKWAAFAAGKLERLAEERALVANAR